MTQTKTSDGKHGAHADVVVIGGGLIGLLTAAELAARGARVLVLEKDDVGFEQSGRSVAAVNLPGGTSIAAPNSMLRVSAEEWSTFEDRWGQPIDLNSDGWYIVVADEQDEDWIAVDRETWRNTAGFHESKTFDATVARGRFPQMEGPFRLLEERHGGHVDAPMVMSGLVQASLGLGVEIERGVMVTGFGAQGGVVTTVKTTRGRVSCGNVLVAAGLWSPSLCECLGLNLPMQRVRAPAVETGPMPANTIPGFLRSATFGARQNRNGSIRITGGYRFSAMLHDLSFADLRDVQIWAPALWKNRKDVSLRLDPSSLWAELGSAVRSVGRRDGGTIVRQDYHPRSNPKDRQPQLHGLQTLIPSLRGARIQRSFSGVIDLTPDLQPVIGRIPGIENAYVATGFSGHGFMSGPGACLGVAQLILDGESKIDFQSYRPERLAEPLIMREQIF